MAEINSNKKIGKARFALLKSKSYIITIIILLVCSLVFPAGLIIQMFEDDYSDTALVGFGLMTAFFSFSIFAFTTVVPVGISKKQRIAAKGNINMYDLFMQFPLTKKQVLSKAFRLWALSSILPIATTIAVCIIPIFYQKAQVLNSQIGLIVVLDFIVLVTIEAVNILASNYKINSSPPFKITLFISVYIAFMFNVIFGDKSWFLNAISGFDIFSGIVGIIITLCIIPLMWILTKVFLLDKKGDRKSVV